MKGSDIEFLEALRLAHKFFPESRKFISLTTGLNWDSFLGAMVTANFRVDKSCYALNIPLTNEAFAAKGGLTGSNKEIYLRLLKHTGLFPQGRTIVIPDALGYNDQSTEDCRPFVCHSRTVPERLQEISCFGAGRNTLFIYESGAALMIDHDDRIYWAQSCIRDWSEGSSDP